MISRRHRFHGHNSLDFLYRNGKTVRADFLSLRFVKSKSDDYRLSVIVSKKVSKSAVVRNRIRRRIYEVVRIIKKESNKTWLIDMAITVFDQSIANIDHKELDKLIKSLLKKAQII